MTHHRLQGIDALRGVAALAVVTMHLSSDFNHQYHPSQPVPFGLPQGGYGVYLFFVISGFVISLTTERARNVKDFVISRFSRLFPVYWAALLLSTLVLWVSALPGALSGAPLLVNALSNVFMIQGWMGIASIDPVYWTLHVEMTFYALMALLIWLGRLSWALPIMLTLTALNVVDQLLFAKEIRPLHDHIRFVLMLPYACFFAAGMVLYRCRQSGFRPWHLLVLVVCSMVPMARNYPPHHPGMDALAAAMSMALVYLASQGSLKWLEVRPLLYLGSVSYALYVCHHWLGVSILRVLDKLGHGGWQGFAVAALASLLVAHVLTSWVEKPALQVLRRFLARRQG